MGWLKEAIPEDLAILLKGGHAYQVGTYGWTESKTGGTSVSSYGYNYVTSGAVATKYCCLYTPANRLGMFAVAGGDLGVFTFAKKTYIIFDTVWVGTDTHVDGEISISRSLTDAPGVMATKGLGVYFGPGRAMQGTSFGESVANVSLGVTMTVGKVYRVMIILYPSTKIEWYVDVDGAGFVLKATQSTAAKIPTGVGADTETALKNMILIDGSGTVDCSLYLFNPWIWQA